MKWHCGRNQYLLEYSTSLNIVKDVSFFDRSAPTSSNHSPLLFAQPGHAVRSPRSIEYSRYSAPGERYIIHVFLLRPEKILRETIIKVLQGGFELLVSYSTQQLGTSDRGLSFLLPVHSPLPILSLTRHTKGVVYHLYYLRKSCTSPRISYISTSSLDVRLFSWNLMRHYSVRIPVTLLLGSIYIR